MALICSPFTQSHTHPLQLILRDPGESRNLGGCKGLLYNHCKIWAVVRRKLKLPSTHRQTPLWDNPGLPELQQLSDRDLWITSGVVYLADMYRGDILKSFQLKDDFGLANSSHFRYLQLRHALQSQFHESPPNLEQLDILEVITGSESQKLISTFFSCLMRPTAVTLAYQLKDRWVRDVGEIEDDEWEEVLDACKKVSHKISDRLTQL